MERLPWKTIEEKYPNQWVGLKEIVWENEDEFEISSAVVVYADKTIDELLQIQLNDDELHTCFTTPDTLGIDDDEE